MATLDEKMSQIAEQVLNRPLKDEERFQIYRIVDAVGMKDVQSFLYLLLVFKLHEETMKKGFVEMTALEEKIDSSLENSIDRILGEGAKRIGVEMGEHIAATSSEILSSVKEFNTMRGYIVATSITGVLATLAYWFGASGLLRMEEMTWPYSGVLNLPAGWWMALSVASYTYFWCFDNWKELKWRTSYKWILALQGFVMAILAVQML